MKRLLKIHIHTLLILSVLFGCMADQKGPGRRVTQSGGVGTDTPDDSTPTDPVFPGSSEVVWFSEKEIPGNLIINEDSAQAIYLRGSAIHRYLSKDSNFNRLYCLVISFNEVNSSAKRQLRARALPIPFNNLTSRTVERLLRIDISQSGDNQNICSGQAYVLSASEQSPSATTPIISHLQSAFAPPELCPSCNGLIVSTNVSLYETRGQNPFGLEIDTETYIPVTQIDMRALGLRIDVQNNSQDPGGSCSYAACQAKGFDCCLEGQCVNDRAEKPNAVHHAQYATALNDISVNPANYINYPEIFYICPKVQTPKPDPEPIPDPAVEARLRFERDRDDYLCLEEAKKDTPDFSALGIIRCQNHEDFITVRSQVWDRCGCEASPFPAEPDEPACPDYGLRAIFNELGAISTILCDIPDPDIEPTPFQTLNLRVPNRSAPHRFFDLIGKNHDDIEKLNQLSPVPVQEGESFSYLDESGKTEPLDAPYSMNAILGQFSTTLNRALPAKVVYVEFDQTYIIAARSGFYTPCPQCAKDAWFQAFSAHPGSQQGVGLQASGYSTSRDSFSGNSTMGNYEDTIFGRACWVPPTMIPFTHRPLPDLEAQRRNRLETQAALYINGYQRDWFGFNKGALIGSFDGVSWFAIGKGRRIRSTSQKLFLAINAPFADLAENTDTIVEIIAEQTGNDTVAEMDYNPEYELNDQRQNTAGTCQHFHQCEVDSDCVSKLGWEYACADVNQFRTNWPKFDINGKEMPGDATSLANFTKFLHGPFPQDNGKRCVYRGAGAICKRDYLSSLDSKMRKQFTCAPNFYCASLGDNSFNNRLVRTPNQVDFILFGQEANILGRPLNYVGANNNLTDNIRANIESNAAAISSLSSDFGICRPGRSLASAAPMDQHRNSDLQQRTDYINQIASCDASATGINRVRGCPAIETRDGQSTAKGDFILTNTADDLRQRSMQNMCGGESKRQNNTGLYESTFKGIESLPIRSLADLITPTIAQDACMRKAGSICHTDLDCSPNKLHAEQAQFFGISAFGNTSAEQKFWQETLVCAQAKPQPFAQSEDYFDYDLTQNRCCRPLGQTITMYTQSNSLAITPQHGAENLGLVTDRLATDDPRANGRYSRYGVVDIDDTAKYPAPRVASNTTPPMNQWKTINDTGKLNCCGGGFIRKFADGTNDWTVRNRLNFAPENLNCLNYMNHQVYGFNGVGNSNTYNRDYDRLCRAPADGGCVQNPIPQANGFEVVFPELHDTLVATVSTAPTPESSEQMIIQAVNTFAPYQPIAYSPTGPPHNLMTTTMGPFNFLADPTFLPATSFYLPLYISTRNDIISVRIQYMNEDGATGTTYASAFQPSRLCPAGFTNPRDSLTNNTWCSEPEPTGTYEVFHLRGDPNYNVGGKAWVVGGVIIEFRTPGSIAYTSAHPGTPQALKPGNDFYYVTKLGRLELLGIPQIFYEPIYCNSDMNQLVPGIFRQNNRTEFLNNSFAYNPAVNGRFLEDLYHTGSPLGFDESNTDGSNNARITFQDQVLAPPIFSENEFKCCQKLGQKVSSQDQCCSGFVVQEGGDLICRLPSGTNLNVYFNRFVSSEGVGTEEPGGGLVDDDFVPETGEPKMNSSVLEKIRALGTQYCEYEEITRGSTLGHFHGEPFSGVYQQHGDIESGRIYSFVDSNFDNDPINDKGYVRFLEGLRWTHHLYCN